MADLTSEHVAASKRLFLSMSAAAFIMDIELQKIYVASGLGRGFFRRGMSKEVKAKTDVEVWAYLSALLVSMVETWQAAPPASEIEVILLHLEGAMIDVQRIDYRPEYEEYRMRFRTKRSRFGVPDSKILGPMCGLHEEFFGRLVMLWGVPSRATCSSYASSETHEKADQTMRAFITVVSDLREKIEKGFWKGLEELWPVHS
jgi:hypothetical protein